MSSLATAESVRFTAGDQATTIAAAGAIPSIEAAIAELAGTPMLAV